MATQKQFRKEVRELKETHDKNIAYREKIGLPID